MLYLYDERFVIDEASLLCRLEMTEETPALILRKASQPAKQKKVRSGLLRTF